MSEMSNKNQRTAKGFFKRACALFLGLTFMSFSLLAQNVQVRGTVTDANTGEPLPGVSVAVEGTSTGAITDVDGKFQVSAPANGVLVFSYVSYKTEKIQLQGQSQVDVKLAPDVTVMDEVVVIGYGSVPKKDLTGTVTSISAKTIKDIPVATTEQALTGRLAGVQVTTTDGSPDAEMIIRVRGGGSITGSNAPLYIIDGFQTNSMNSISVADIQTIDVLKDASATAIYGSRGANGVIIITTKSAKSGKTTVTYNNFFQSKTLANRMDVMDPYEFVLFNYEYAALRGTTSADFTNFTNKFGVYGDLDLYKYQKGHDYQEDMFGATATSYQHNLSITGGNEKTRFALSGTMNRDNGLMKSNNYNRKNFNFKLNHDISDKLWLDLNARYTDVTVNGSGTSGGTYKIRSSQAITRSAVEGLEEFQQIDLTSMTEEELRDYYDNHMTLADQAQQYWKKRLDGLFNVTAAINWEITKGLVFRSQGSYETGSNQLKNYYGPKTSQSSNEGQNLPLVDWTKGNRYGYQISNTLTYKFNFASKQSIETMIGQETLEKNDESNYMQAKYFDESMSPETIFANIQLSSGTNNFFSRSNIGVKYRLVSYFGRMFYSLKDRYLATLVFRTDGSSRFSKENQWAFFPAASVAWRISEEEFMKNQNVLSTLKVRGSYGTSGNDNIPENSFVNIYAAGSGGSNSSGKYYGVGEVINPYYVTLNQTLPNTGLRWETNYTTNLGLDFGFFRDVINGTVDIYKNYTDHLLVRTPINAPGYNGQQQNIGKTSNKGIEITLNANIIERKNFSLSTTFNISMNRPKVEALATEIVPQSGWAGTDMKGSDDYRVMVGQPLGIMYGFVTDGYYTTDDFDPVQSVNGKYVLLPSDDQHSRPKNGILGGAIGVRPGTIKLKDLNGDGVIDTDNDRTIIGNATPKHIGGFGLSSRFYGFDLGVNFNWVYGNDVFNANKIASTQNWRYSYPNLLNEMNSGKRYTYIDQNGQVVNDLATLKEMNEVGANKKEYWSPFSFGSAVIIPHSWAVEDGSYLRLQNITLGYTLPSNLTRKAGIQNLRFFGTLYNVWVWTNYSGYDPEVSTPARGSSYNQLTPGVDFSSYPKSFSYTLGLNVTF